MRRDVIDYEEGSIQPTERFYSYSTPKSVQNCVLNVTLPNSKNATSTGNAGEGGRGDD